MKELKKYVPFFAYRLLRKINIVFCHYRIKLQDVMVASYPKSGNTWLRFMLGELVSNAEVDYLSIREYIPAFTSKSLSNALTLPGGGRLIKTHEPYEPAVYKRALYLVRDVRAVLVSYYRHLKNSGGPFNLSIEQFTDIFIAGRVDGYGDWGRHVWSWKAAAGSNQSILFVRYEDLRADPELEFGRIASALGFDPSCEELGGLVARNSIEAMREKNRELRKQMGLAHDDDSLFVRRGAVLGWQDELPAAVQDKMVKAYGDTLIKLGYPV